MIQEDEVESRPDAFGGVETALEELRLEVEDDPEDVLEDYEKRLESVRREHREIVDGQVDDLERATSRYVTLLEGFLEEYRGFMEQNIEDLEGLELRRQRVIGSYSDILDKARTEYREMIEGRIDTLEDLAGHKQRGMFYGLLAGSALTGAGLLAANAYPFTEGILDFYSEAPSIYLDDPGTAVLTLGLPVAGVYLFKKAYDRWNEYREIDSELRELRERRLEDRLERSEEDFLGEM